MTLIVEDGSIVAGAESYATTAYATTYHAARGNTTWALLTTAQMEEALRRATDYMVQCYRRSWAGYRADEDQVLDWPRIWVPITDGPVGYRSFPAYVVDTLIPDEVKKACAALALRAAAGDLSPDIEPAVTNERVGSISVSYAPGSSQVVRFREIDNLLASFLKRSAFIAPMVRA